jgi:hypothetical protein
MQSMLSTQTIISSRGTDKKIGATNTKEVETIGKADRITDNPSEGDLETMEAPGDIVHSVVCLTM